MSDRHCSTPFLSLLSICLSRFTQRDRSLSNISMGSPRYQATDKIQLNTDVIELRYLDREEDWEVTISYLAPGTGDLSESQRREI